MRVVLKFYVIPYPRVHQHYRFILEATWNVGLNCSKVNLYHERFSALIRLCGLDIQESLCYYGVKLVKSPTEFWKDYLGKII